MLPRITVAGLGPAGPEFMTTQTRQLASAPVPRYLRTRRHPSAEALNDAIAFDEIYNQAETIEAVYVEIVERLVTEASAHGSIAYFVPGSPMIAEVTVQRLLHDSRVDVNVLPAVSFLDIAWSRLGVDPLAMGVRLIDGRHFAIEAAGERGPLLVAQCDASWVLSGIKLAFEDEDVAPEDAVVLQRLGLADESVERVAWHDLDRVIEPDHLTSLWIPTFAAPVAYELARVDEVARRLRLACPWDREQDHSSLGRYLIEEAYELIDAIDALDSVTDDEHVASADDDLIEELGDVFFQAFAHSAIGAEGGRFTIADVARGVADKLIERHPHVYGDTIAETSDEVMATWESSKKAAKGRTSVMDGIPRYLPALFLAAKVLRKAAQTGIELPDIDLPGNEPSDIQDTQETEDAHEFGDELLRLVDRARKARVDPEEALRRATAVFRTRFELAEQAACRDGIEITTAPPDTVRRYWEAVH